ncbi:hypothetical protein [Chroococcidiopsis sp.]|uniref:hypothetical protein n=1 Tax=Chroococcidiopsis sp. TaxID=3088168 RepID=UPI003F345FD9
MTEYNFAFPSGIPHYWMYETSGKLKVAIHAYLNHMGSKSAFPMSDDHIALIREYFRQWIFAPAYMSAEGFEAEKAALRESVGAIATVRDIDRWLDRANQIGIDPL